ncbi:MAG: type VI secretion system tube protein Hcp [Victivallaceae bacterium]|nr:type VI secretion system tube protein Hcp [Victivallaceae bacterium]
MASDFFIKLDGIDGNSTDSAHAKWIEVISYEHGCEHTVVSAAGGRGADVSGRGQFKPFVFVHQVDSATAKIQDSCMKSNVIPKVMFHVCKSFAGAQLVGYDVTMESVKICPPEVSSQEIDGVMLSVEKVSLIPAKMTWKFTATNIDGTKGSTTEASFDVTKNA